MQSAFLALIFLLAGSWALAATPRLGEDGLVETPAVAPPVSGRPIFSEILDVPESPPGIGSGLLPEHSLPASLSASLEDRLLNSPSIPELAGDSFGGPPVRIEPPVEDPDSELDDTDDPDPDDPQTAELAGDEPSIAAPAPLPSEAKSAAPEEAESAIDWRSAARRLKDLLVGPVKAVQKAVRTRRGKLARQGRQQIARVSLSEDEVVALLRLRPIVPVDGIGRNELTDSFFARRSGHRRHNAIDIPAAESTPVVAAVDGVVLRRSHTKKGGNGLYLIDPTRRFSFYYAHLSAYVDGIRAGSNVKKGDVLGFVGHTGNAKRRGPHLHFALATLDSPMVDPGLRIKRKAVLNPYPLLAFIP